MWISFASFNFKSVFTEEHNWKLKYGFLIIWHNFYEKWYAALTACKCITICKIHSSANSLFFKEDLALCIRKWFYLQITENVILKQSFLAKMDGASQNCGCVILIMTVEMTQMSPHICAGKVWSVSFQSMCILCCLHYLMIGPNYGNLLKQWWTFRFCDNRGFEFTKEKCTSSVQRRYF